MVKETMIQTPGKFSGKKGIIFKFRFPVILLYFLVAFVAMRAGNAFAQSTDGSVSDSYSRAAVTGTTNTGGLAGRLSGNISVQRSYSSGLVRGQFSDTGGLVGQQSGPVSVTGSYWDVGSSGIEQSAAGEARTTGQMTLSPWQNTYTGWNFNEVWAHDESSLNSGYPYLAQIPPVTFRLELISNLSNAGYSAGRGNYGKGTLVALQAFANEGYDFENWTHDGNAVVSASAKFIFEMPATDIRLTANFITATDITEYETVIPTIYPNPFNNEIRIDNPMPFHRITITNIFGQCIMDIPIPETSFLLNTASLPEGIYVITFNGPDNKRLVKKMIKY